jgi:hypothetical protein
MNHRLSLLGPSDSAYGLEQANFSSELIVHYVGRADEDVPTDPISVNTSTLLRAHKTLTKTFTEGPLHPILMSLRKGKQNKEATEYREPKNQNLLLLQNWNHSTTTQTQAG